MTDTYIRVRIRVPGAHHWKQAPDSVDYLRSVHRHLFNITVTKKVTHDDRESEFFTEQLVIREELKNNVASDVMPGDFHTFDTMSCEMIAKRLLRSLNRRALANGIGKDLYTSVIVSEDGENESEVTL